LETTAAGAASGTRATAANLLPSQHGDDCPDRKVMLTIL
jgi:hypothetical protein